MKAPIIFVFFITIIVSLSNNYSTELYKNNITDDLYLRNKADYPELLNNIDTTIYINDSIRPGYSITIDLSNEIPDGYYIRTVSSANPKNLRNNQETDYEWGNYIIENSLVKFFLHSSFESKDLFLLIDIYNNATSKIIELQIPVFHITFKECIFNGNYICNADFEEYKFTGALDAYEFFAGCVNANNAIQSWFGSSSDLIGRNDFFLNTSSNLKYYTINRYFRYTHGESNGRFVEHIDYNPDTWDNDVNNKGYMNAQAIKMNLYNDFDEKNNLSGESTYQNLIKPLDKQKKYILEYFVFVNTSGFSDTQFSTIDDIPIYSSAWLADYDPCTYDDYREQLKKTDDKQQIEKTLLEQHKWHHIKSKAFSVDKPMSWFWIGYAMGPGLKDNLYIYSLKFDDIILREVGTGITSYVDNYNPCLGDVIEYKFKIWKDDPADRSNLEVHNKLPDGLEYIDGSFTLGKDGILKTIIKDNEFDSLGIAWLSMTVLVPINHSLTNKELVNEIYFPDMPEELRPSVGKYKIMVHVGEKLFDIKQAIHTTKCRGDTAEIVITVANISNSKINNFSVTIFEMSKLNLIWKDVQVIDTNYNYRVEVNRPEISLNDKIVNIFGYSNGQYIVNERNDIILNSLFLEPNESLVIKIKGVLNQKGTELISTIIAAPQFDGCQIIALDTFSVFGQVIDYDIFALDTISCKTLTLYSPYPEYHNLWSTGSSEPYISIQKTGLYFLEVTDFNGCKIIDSIYVQLVEEFEVRIDKPIGYQFKGDSITIPIIFHLNNSLADKKNIEIIFELNGTNLEILDGDFQLTKIGSIDNIVKYRLISQKTIPIFEINKKISIDLKFYIKDTQNLEYDINFESIIINESCQLLNSGRKIHLLYDNNNIIKISNFPYITNSFDIYPTPFNDFLILQFNLHDNSDISINISDLLGRIVDSFQYQNIRRGIYNYRFNTQYYLSGFYNICVIINNQIMCKKLIKN